MPRQFYVLVATKNEDKDEILDKYKILQSIRTNENFVVKEASVLQRGIYDFMLKIETSNENYNPKDDISRQEIYPFITSVCAYEIKN